MASGWRLLVQNGALQEHDPGQVTSFLRSHPEGKHEFFQAIRSSRLSGAFTVTRTADRGARLLLWERHLARLAQSLRLLRTGTFSPSPSSHSLPELLNPSLRAGLGEALKRRSEKEELAVTVHLRHSDERSLDVSVHISSFVPAIVVNTASVAVMGPSRPLPLAKSSQWVSARQVLEQCKPENATEVVLSNDGQHLLEGSISNFFVVLSSDGRVTVKTAALENGVLPGTIRQLVIEICHDTSIPVSETSPSWDERSSWKEAFVTNSLSLIQPVRSIKMPVPWNANFDPKQWSQSTWQPLHLMTNGDVTQMLQKEIFERAKNYGYLTSDLLGTASIGKKFI
ncbi:uncharacterized protein LOC9639494 isoform X1 [Selaginella moellendorffii]|uniref:uncharacterized protein LOC9639494 isoform X1 n=1 Tax=Selaginella moellendorffii TaxID=88036 RepID=UPI000D1CC253|nr:uncharacterized protein LOC9639494 isoform X1 [Selaginella moellendorffii]|eukprot:XP_024520974.1 uncharacterized protein LOC9639494 isoform X1 [Selaginella moellendorffii]